MPDLSTRSYEKELLDRNDIPFNDIKRNMQELEVINAKLGGHAITLQGLKEILQEKKEPFSICEIGCGGGDNLKAISYWCSKRKISVKLAGIDINNDCIEYARENCRELKSVQFITSDYLLVDFSDYKPDIIFSSLFCHHLNDEQFVDMMLWCKRNSGWGFFINDLHRNFFAYHSIKLLTFLFSKSYLVKNDAPLSVLRGFKKQDWRDILQQAGITNYLVEWKWAFRYLVVVPD